MRATLLTALAMLACAGAARAADPPSKVVRELTKAPLEQPLSPSKGIQITAEKGDTSVAFRYGGSTAAGKGFGTPSSTAIYTSYSVTASAPLSKKGDTQLANLDALASGFVLEARLTQTWTTRADGAYGDAMMGMCQTIEARLPVKEPVAPANQCSMDFIHRYATEEDLKAFEALLWGSPEANILGFSARLGQDSFDFFDPTTLVADSSDKQAWSVKGFWAYRPLKRPWILTFSAEHLNAYEATDSAMLCLAGNGGPMTTCVNGPIGAPQKVRKNIVSAEYRRAFKGFSAAAVLQYDVKNDVSAVQVPIYLVRDKDGALNGGVKLGWRSDTDDFTAGVFIGTAFGLGAPY